MLVSIDPGVTGTGYAFWLNGNLKIYGSLNLSKEYAGLPWMRKVEHLTTLYTRLLLYYKPPMGQFGRVVLEYPSYMAGVGGHMVAEKGDLVKLAFLTGMLSCISSGMATSIQLVEVAKWKGQLPKSVCEDRVRRIVSLPEKRISNHAIDAIGIGLWALGKF